MSVKKVNIALFLGMFLGMSASSMGVCDEIKEVFSGFRFHRHQSLTEQLSGVWKTSSSSVYNESTYSVLPAYISFYTDGTGRIMVQQNVHEFAWQLTDDPGISDMEPGRVVFESVVDIPTVGKQYRMEIHLVKNVRQPNKTIYIIATGSAFSMRGVFEKTTPKESETIDRILRPEAYS